MADDLVKLVPLISDPTKKKKTQNDKKKKTGQYLLFKIYIF